MHQPLSLRLYLVAHSRPERSLRRAADREDASKVAQERLGTATIGRPDGPVIWIHTGKDPDGFAARDFGRRLWQERGDVAVLITTDASRRRRDVEEPLLSQFAPSESVPAIRRFLQYWRPDVAIWTEPAPRPALAAETLTYGSGLYLLDSETGSVEPPAWRPWRTAQSALLGGFNAILTGNAARAEALRRLGAQPERLETVGFLQEGSAALPYNADERDLLAQSLSGRPIWLAAMVGMDELDAVVDTHRRILQRAHRMVLILNPADTETGRAMQSGLAMQGFQTALRSHGEDPESDTQIYIADEPDELGLWYRLAPVSFLGQSLEDGGGINPYQPAALGSAILHGPHVSNYLAAYDRLAAAGASRLIHDVSDITAELDALLSPEVAASRAHAAWQVCSAGAEVTDYALDLILTELDRREGEGA